LMNEGNWISKGISVGVTASVSSFGFLAIGISIGADEMIILDAGFEHKLQIV
jgi:hypothetical protein